MSGGGGVSMGVGGRGASVCVEVRCVGAYIGRS